MYKTHTLDEYNLVMDLRKKLGWGPTKIFSFLLKRGIHIRYGAMSDWIYTDKKPFQEKVLSKIPEESRNLTKEKAYILGVLCGDGYIRITKHGNFLVGLDVCDEDFADEFRKCLQNVYKLCPSKNIRRPKYTNFSNNPKPRHVINLTSKLVVQDLLRYSESFKTKEWKVPEQIKISDLKIKSAFLRGLFDSEGTASLEKPYGVYLSVCSGNEVSLLEIKEMLRNDFNIDLSIVHFKSIIRLKSAGYKNVKNFYENINFIIKRKRDKLMLGLLTYKRKGIRRYSAEFKQRALQLLDKYNNVTFVANLLNTSVSNVSDWKNGRYITNVGDVENDNRKNK